MCGRYYLAGFNGAEVKEYYKVLEELDRKIKTPGYNLNVTMTGEIYPSFIVPVIANSKENQIKGFAMEWGYTMNNGNRLINARSETASENPTFTKNMIENRCLIPASYYFEWEEQNSDKVKHALQPIGKTAFFMAGLYRMEEEKQTPVFTILTRAAAPNIKFIHERMPVILPAGARADWLNLDYNADEIIMVAALNMAHSRMS